MYCSSCAAAVTPGLSYCNRCGAELIPKKSAASSKGAQLIESLVWAIVGFLWVVSPFLSHDGRDEARAEL
jgi:hypothetical protein